MPTESLNGFCRDGVSDQAGELLTRFEPDMLLANRKFGPDPPRFPDIRVLGQPVVGADNIRSQPQAGPSGLAVGPGRLGLHPVQQGQAELAGAAFVSRPFFRADINQVAEPVIVLRPVDQADVALVRSLEQTGYGR